MHVLSELRNPLFDTPDRQRAIRALQMARILRDNNSAKAWQAVKNMIDKAIAEYQNSPKSKPQSSGSYAGAPGQISNNTKMEDPSNDDVRVYPAMGIIPEYTLRNAPIITSEPQELQPQNNFMPQMQSMPDLVQPNWDDLNLNHINNIVGDVQPTPGVMPDFDFVSIPFMHQYHGANTSRASGVIHSTMRANPSLQYQWKAAIFLIGPGNRHNAPELLIRSTGIY